MAYNFDDASSEGLDLGDNLDTSPDFTAIAWVNPDDTTARHLIMSKWDVAGDNRAWFYEINSGGTVRAFASTDGTFQAGNTVSSTGTIGTTSFSCIAFVQDGTNTNMTLYINGSQDGQNAAGPATVFNTGTATFKIGAQVSLTLGMDGDIAEAAFFQEALGVDEIAAMAAGYSPLFFASRSLAMYVPMVRDLVDVVGGLSISQNGTPTVANHPSMIYQTRPLIGHNSAAAPPSGRIMSSLVAAGGLAGKGGIAGQGGGLAG